MTWHRSGPYLVHEASGYMAPCHWHALEAGTMPAHVARQPWCSPRDAAAFRAEWAALHEQAKRQRQRDDERTAQKRNAGQAGDVPNWARQHNPAAGVVAALTHTKTEAA